MSAKSIVTRTFGRTSLKVQKNSPHLLFGMGVIGAVTSTVLACRATLKLEKAVDGLKFDVDAIKSTDYTDDERGDKSDRKDLVYAYSKGTFEIVKLYAPAIAVGGASLIALTGSHVQLSRRNTALTVAYTGLHQAYNEYRSRVRDHVGEEKERDLYYGMEFEETKDGKGKTTAVKVLGDPNKLSAYACIFDEASPNWTKDPELNFLYVKAQQNWMNDLLQARGHVFLNEVYDALGINRSSAGQIVGWAIGPEGDNFVDFGLYADNSSRFVNGEERSIVLDFNCNGVIYNQIG